MLSFPYPDNFLISNAAQRLDGNDEIMGNKIGIKIFQVVLSLLDCVWIVALICLPLAWLFDPFEFRLGTAHFTCHWGLKPVLMLFGLLFMRFLVCQAGRFFFRIEFGGLWKISWFRRTVLALATIIIFFSAIEGILLAVDFKYEMPAIIFEGKDEFGGIEISNTIPDTELLYRFKPGDVFAGRKINSLGFREREVDPVKKQGTIRVICMGDSVTGQGLPGYSEYLNEFLGSNPPTARPWEAFNTGVHGYSVQQGLIQFRRQVRPLNPDIVTIYFGWNDHWLERQSDEKMMAVRLHPVLGKLFERLGKKRIFMAMHALINSGVRQKPNENDRILRVPPKRYEQLLRQLTAEIKSSGAVPVIITAARRSLTDQTVGQCRIPSVDEGNRIHDQYIAISREVARKTGTPLFDLAEIFSSPECDRYFAADGIHFDQFSREGAIARMLPPEAQPGLRRIALELHKFLVKLAATREWASHEKM